MKVNVTLLVGQIAFLALVFALTLFLAAGTVAWPAGWLFLALFFGFVLALTLWLLRNNPALLTERMTVSRPDQKTWDKLFFALMNVGFIGWLVLMPLDAVRFGWSRVPVWLQIVGAVILIGSFFLFFVTFRENTFLSPMVRIQHDRGQTVVTTGPYGYVRHPMYAAFLVLVVGTALLLGSWFGVLAGLALVVGVGRRAVLEERALRDELHGYRAYMAAVKYRFVPGIW